MTYRGAEDESCTVYSSGLSVNLLPTMRRTVEDTWSALRGGLRQERWRALRLFLVTGTVNALRHGDMVVEAAESRGFFRDAATMENHRLAVRRPGADLCIGRSECDVVGRLRERHA